MSVVVAIPVLARPHRVAAVLDALSASEGDLRLRAFFVCSPGDGEQIAAVAAAGADCLIVTWEPGAGDFARKTNAAFRRSSEPWFFAGADDLHFHPGWADEAVRVAEQDEVGMVGTNDLGNSTVMAGRHSTHSLFRRSYVEECGTIDQPGEVYHEGYDHSFCDNEAYETAIWRDCFSFAADARVEHLHPFWHKSSMDSTYQKGLAQTAGDRRLFNERRKLWQE